MRDINPQDNREITYHAIFESNAPNRISFPVMPSHPPMIIMGNDMTRCSWLIGIQLIDDFIRINMPLHGFNVLG